jgi:hypothetical protein
MIEWSDGTTDTQWQKDVCRTTTTVYVRPRSSYVPLPTLPALPNSIGNGGGRSVIGSDVETFGAGTMSCYRITTTYYSDGTQTKTPSQC